MHNLKSNHRSYLLRSNLNTWAQVDIHHSLFLWIYWFFILHSSHTDVRPLQVSTWGFWSNQRFDELTRMRAFSQSFLLMADRTPSFDLSDSFRRWRRMYGRRLGGGRRLMEKKLFLSFPKSLRRNPRPNLREPSAKNSHPECLTPRIPHAHFFFNEKLLLRSLTHAQM